MAEVTPPLDDAATVLRQAAKVVGALPKHQPAERDAADLYLHLRAAANHLFAVPWSQMTGDVPFWRAIHEILCAEADKLEAEEAHLRDRARLIEVVRGADERAVAAMMRAYRREVER